jgi:hypothetical protein
MRHKRDETFRFIMTTAEKSALEALAEHEDGSQAAVVRRLVRAEARRRGLWPVPDEPAPPVEWEVPA